MKRYLALFMIALMAVSVIGAAGVVTTSKAAAAGWPPAKTIAYVSGKTYTFTPAQFNLRSAAFNPDTIGTSTHREFVNGAKAFSSIQTTTEQTGEIASLNGVHLQLTGVDPATDLDKPCTVTIKAGYTLSAMGDAYTQAGISIVGAFHSPPQQWVIDTVHGGDAVTTKAVDKQTYTFTSTLGDVFGPNLDHGPIFVNAAVAQWQPGAGAATAQAQVSSITVTFN